MFPRSSLVPALLLFLTVQILSTGDCWTGSQKRRHKREWVVPAKRFTENVDYSDSPYFSKIRSDLDEISSLRYTVRGPGVNQPPVGNFILDEKKGWVRITRTLDREERQNYTLIATAWYPNNTIAEDNIKINIIVEDQNDNPPVFNKPERVSIYEGRPDGTFVTQVVAKDKDEPNTLHTKIAYSLIKQEPNNGTLFFAVHKDNGAISVNNPTIDREEHKSFILTVQAADMYGSPEGNSATTTVFIDILDVNDNIPTLEKDEFSASIDENEAPVEVLRIQALDNDEESTDNWLAEFDIVSGNEDGRFSIQTDPKTNMGVLYLNKPVDFESASDMNLKLVVANKAHPGAPLASGAGGGDGAGAGGGDGAGAGGGAGASGAGGGGGAGAGGGGGAGAGGGGGAGAGGGGGAGASGGGGAGASGAGFGGSVLKQKTYSVKIGVKNKPEGPKFKPRTKPISVSENTKNYFPRVIDTYTAIEEDTGKTAEKVKYAKAYDPDNWISIDTDTAEIKLNKVPDRESPFVVNGTYYAKILCITDELHSQTSTGTIALQVEDLNDNCPKLLNNVQTVCSDTSVVNVTAEDHDSDPNGAPLEFSLIEEKTRGKWNLQRINDVSVSMLPEDHLWPGFYEVTMEIRDKQGLACPDEQVLRLEVCTCSEGLFCSSKVAALHTTSASIGATGIGFLLLGFLCIILALVAVIKCDCGNAGKHFTDMPFDTKQHLMSYSTEGKGIDGDASLMRIPPKLYNEGGNAIKLPKDTLQMVKAKSYYPLDEIQGPRSNQTAHNSAKMVGEMQESAFGGFYSDMDMENSVRWQEGQVLHDAFLKEYFAQKSTYILEDDSPIKGLKLYDYEGEGSVTGSIENCSFIESNDDLEFLNNLGLKFRTLAEVCGFRQTDPNVIVNTVETTPNEAASSSKMTNIVQPSPEEIPVKSPLVQPSPDEKPVKPPLLKPAPTQEIVIQEPMYYGFNQPMSRNVVLSEDGLGQGVYIINGTPEAERILTQGKGYTLAHTGQQAVLANNIIGNSFLYSQIGPQSPIMITEGLVDINQSVIQNFSPTQNLVMMPQQQLDGIGSLQMVRVSGGNAQGRVTLMDGSVNGGKVFIDRPMSPQQFYPVNSQELGGSVHMNQRVVDGSLYSAQNDGQGTVTIGQCPVNGGNVMIGGSGTQNLVIMPQIAPGQVNNQLLESGPFPSASNIISKEGSETRLLVGGHSTLEGPVSDGNLLVASPGQFPVSMSTRAPNLVRLAQVTNGHLPSVQNIVSGEGGQSRSSVSGSTILEGPSQLPLAMSPGIISPFELPQVANRQLFRSKVSRVLTSMAMMPKSKGLASNGQLNVEQ
ncbi:desmoglein-2-like protein [Carassius carassius]|uniref:desmoglein-2-like protein n=1 Tax=Carassius carassius TaxID=217509 RepID=UPI0028685D15|nr:desmoglein-2-like protein [Carassius carassius]